MKTERILSLAFAILMLISCMSFTHAEEADNPTYEKGDGYLKICYSSVNNGIVNKKETADLEKYVEFNGVQALKVVPIPEKAQSPTVNLDSWEFSKYPKRSKCRDINMSRLLITTTPKTPALPTE